mgnify:CR=1 FL=1
MPQFTRTFEIFLGEANQKASHADSNGQFDKFEGLYPMPVMGGVNQAVVMEGSEMITQRTLMRPLLPSGATGYDSDDINLNAPEGSMLLILLDDQKVAGNIFVNLMSGQGNGLWREHDGTAGEGRSMFQTLWGGREKIPVGSGILESEYGFDIAIGAATALGAVENPTDFLTVFWTHNASWQFRQDVFLSRTNPPELLAEDVPFGNYNIGGSNSAKSMYETSIRIDDATGSNVMRYYLMIRTWDQAEEFYQDSEILEIN